MDHIYYSLGNIKYKCKSQKFTIIIEELKANVGKERKGKVKYLLSTDLDPETKTVNCVISGAQLAA